MVAKIIGAQRDFSYGEVDPELKRSDDHPARKGGLRQMANARILNAGGVQDRPGRRALYPVSNNGVRTERFLISAGNVFDIQFAPGRLKIINSLGVTVANFTAQGNSAVLPWVSAADINSIVYAVSPNAATQSITITFGHAMRPQVVTFDGVATWTIADYNELMTIGGQKRTPFYRLSPQNVLIQPSATTGAITIKFSSPIVVAGMVGTRIRYASRQILLGAIIDTSNMHATVIESLPPAQTLTLSSSVGNFTIGDELIGNSSGAKGIVTSGLGQQYVLMGSFTQKPAVGQLITGATSGATGIAVSVDPFSNNIAISLNTGTSFVVGETISGAWGSNSVLGATGSSLVVQLIQQGNSAAAFTLETVASISGSAVVSAVALAAPQSIEVWDDEVFNSFRGFPASVFVDQFRLGFCDIPALPGAIVWSAINSQADLYTGANPSDSFLEIAPNKVQVYYVVPGPEGSEFVFCDSRIYYIPISETNPLKPGSVAFKTLSGDGAGQVKPQLAQEAILYVNAGLSSVMAVIATGAYLRPFNTKSLSEFHFHLFNGITAIAAPRADGTFNERYAYVLNGDGSIAVGKYDADTLPGNQPVIGWGPWSGAGAVSWIAAYRADVLFTSSYGGASVVEILDDSQYLDCALPVNAAPAAFAPPAGQGPLWFAASQSVSLMDQSTRSMGTYQVDATGNIVPQNNGGEDLTRLDLVAGQPWTMITEPFCPDASPGNDVGQRMFPRRVSRFAAYVAHSSGFIMGRLFSGRITPTSPALGALMNFTRFPAWNQGDDPTKPPPQRETAERTRPLGRSFDPRVAVIKDTPGPLTILELGMESTI